LNHFPAPALHQLEHLRRLPADVAHERRLDFFRVALHAGKQLMQRIKHIG